MGQTFTGLLKAVRARTGQDATVQTAPASLRLCGDYLAGLAAVGPLSDARRTRLVAAIGGLTTACGTDADSLFDALLRTGLRALESGGETETRLALDIAVEATGLRPRSKGAWRLRGRALDALGRRDEAVEAYEHHLTLQQNPASAQDIVRRIATLKELRACLEEAAELVPGEDGTRLRALRDAPAAEARTAFAEVVRQRTAGAGGMSDPAVRRLNTLYAAYRRLLDRDRTADPLLGGAEPLGVPALRRLVAGRSVVLVAGAPRIAEEERAPGSRLAELIGGYDLVVRCDGVPADAPRTDLHAVTLRGGAPWTGPAWNDRAETRIVFGDTLAHWRRALRTRLVAGAQDRIGDASLRHPLDDPALLGEDGWGTRTSTAFTVLRLLDFLDAAGRLDLIGFGLPGQLLPRERAWVAAHARHEDETEMRTALR
ncbi:tetratricopeptide repeat protein [Streptomyces sp. NPDC006516]|uniref:tetratricopeptide repeat protein n=1 Tax=Streptomyces sp. NPDC006516 TaxID=3154309 RepID=UPI0033B39A6F